MSKYAGINGITQNTSWSMCIALNPGKLCGHSSEMARTNSMSPGRIADTIVDIGIFFDFGVQKSCGHCLIRGIFNVTDRSHFDFQSFFLFQPIWNNSILSIESVYESLRSIVQLTVWFNSSCHQFFRNVPADWERYRLRSMSSIQFRRFFFDFFQLKTIFAHIDIWRPHIRIDYASLDCFVVWPNQTDRRNWISPKWKKNCTNKYHSNGKRKKKKNKQIANGNNSKRVSVGRGDLSILSNA